MAEVYFYDDFERENLYSKWVFSGDDSLKNNWKIVDSQLENNLARNLSSFIFPVDNISLFNLEVSADIFAKTGVDQQFVARMSDDQKTYYQVDFRYLDPGYTIDGGDIRLIRWNNGEEVLLTRAITSDYGINYSNSLNKTRKIKIIFDSLNIKVYFDGIKMIDYTDSGSLSIYLPGKFGLKNWGGNYGNVQNYYDNYFVTSVGATDIFPGLLIPSLTLTPSPTPTVIPTPEVTVTSIPLTPTLTLTPTLVPTLVPTLIPTVTPVLPTPTPIVKHKIIILPGMGASWNSEAMVYGKETDDWKMTPFVKNYEGLIKSLENNGLSNGSDFYVWNYDWRKPMSTIIKKLDDFIKANVGNDEKVDLVGHSLGGVVARVWAEDHNDDRLGKIITLGSPEMGSLNAYKAWNGAELGKASEISTIALNVLLQLQRKNFQTTLETLKNYAPIVKDLLPTFNFTDKKIQTKNNFLIAKNIKANEVFSKLYSTVGIGESTAEYFKLGERSILDKMLGYWPDGEIKKEIWGNGDKTVLIKSARFENQTFDTIQSNHGEIVDKSLAKILDELGLDTTKIASGATDDLSNKLLFFIGSPVSMAVKCGKNVFNPDDQGFLLINDNLSKCQVEIVGKEKGTYHLVWGKIDEKNGWQYEEKNIGMGETDLFVIDSNNGEIVSGSEKFLYGLIKSDVGLLNRKYPRNNHLEKILKAVDKKNNQIIKEELFNFREERKESIISARIMDNLVEVMSIKNQRISKKVAKSVVERTENKIKLWNWKLSLTNKWVKSDSKMVGLNYQKANEYLDKQKQSMNAGNFSKVIALGEMVDKLDEEWWSWGMRWGIHR